MMAILLLATATVGSPAGKVLHSKVNISLAFANQSRV
jgi:hypothetical protein